MEKESKKLPYYEISGGYKEIGEFIGTTFRKQIQESVRKRKLEIDRYDTYLEKSNACLSITREYFPNLIDESEAIANSAEVPLIDYFFINNREAYDPFEESDRQDMVNQDHCTVVVGFNNGFPIIGHNEDWSIDVIDELYILKVKMKERSFIGLNYNVGVPGLSASMNSFGLVQCINDLHQANGIGVPKNYIARAILEAKSLTEAEEIIESVPRASGFNHVLVQGENVRNIEIAGDRVGIENSFGKPYIHTNHYLTPELKEYEDFHTKSSERRYERARELVKEKMGFNDVRGILSDRQDSEYPICREKETIGSAIFLPNESKAFFCYGLPSENSFVEYSL